MATLCRAEHYNPATKKKEGCPFLAVKNGLCLECLTLDAEVELADTGAERKERDDVKRWRANDGERPMKGDSI